MTSNERALVFDCEDHQLVGIVHESIGSDVGVVVVVGGPQYRVGSHRQFLLLARYLAAQGVSVLRFDYRGMGDSEGAIRTFEDINEDIKSAVDAFVKECPGLRSIVLWGLCDAASACLFYGHTDPRVKQLVLLNPWVRTEAGQAKAYLRHYYVRRVIEPEFWKKLFSGSFDVGAALKSFLNLVKNTRRSGVTDAAVPESSPSNVQKCVASSLPDGMLDGLSEFSGRAHIIISGDDLTAAEFMDLIKSSKGWKQVLKKRGVDFRFLDEANHTFSTRRWRDQVAEWTLEWVKGS